MEHYFNNQSLPHDAQIYRKKLAVLFAVTKTIFYRIRLRSPIGLIGPRSLTNDRRLRLLLMMMNLPLPLPLLPPPRSLSLLLLLSYYFLDPEGGSQKATLVVVISFLKIPKGFLIRSGAQRNFAYTFLLTFPTDLPSQIFK